MVGYSRRNDDHARSSLEDLTKKARTKVGLSNQISHRECDKSVH